MTGEVPIRSDAVATHLLRERAGVTELLLMRRTDTDAGTWCQCAGAIEAGETAWQAALREVREETGLVPERFYYGDILERFYVPESNVIEVLPIFVGYVSADAQVVLNDEHDAFEWLEVEAAYKRVTYSGQRRCIAHVVAEFVDREPNELLRIALPVDGQ